MSPGPGPRPGTRLVVIGLGSNTDGPVQIERALTAIAREFDVLVRSTRYAGPPEIDPKSEPDPSLPPYSNVSILIRTADDHAALKGTLRAIESDLGRDRSHGERVAIDIDILLIEGEVIREAGAVIVPHPDLTSRRHAALPSAEVAPLLLHSVTAERLSAIAARLA